MVRCGACHQPFLLPDFAGEDGQGQHLDTAIIDTRADAGASDERDPAKSEMRPEFVAGSSVPTLIVHERPLPRMGSEHPTIVVSGRRPDAMAETIKVVPPPEPPPSEPPAKKPTLRDMDTQPDHKLTRSQRPTIITLDTSSLKNFDMSIAPVDALTPLPRKLPDAHTSETVKAAEIPPAALLLDPETPRSTAATQPTPPPPEYVARVKEKPPEEPIVTTQPAVEPERNTARPIVVVLAAFLIGGTVAGAFLLADAHTGTQSERFMLEWNQQRAAERAANVAQAIEGNMKMGRPDMARRYVQGLGDEVQVLRVDGSRAFQPRDLAGYKVAMRLLCDEAGMAARTKGLPSTALEVYDRFRGGDDQTVRALGGDPCLEATRVETVAPVIDADFAAKVASGGSPKSTRAWLDGDAGSRSQVVVHPVGRQAVCRGCHEGQGDAVGFVVLRTDLGPLDASLKANHNSILTASVIATSVCLILLLVCIALLGKRSAPL